MIFFVMLTSLNFQLYSCIFLYDQVNDRKTSNLNVSLVPEQNNYLTHCVSSEYLLSFPLGRFVLQSMVDVFGMTCPHSILGYYFHSTKTSEKTIQVCSLRALFFLTLIRN